MDLTTARNGLRNESSSNPLIELAIDGRVLAADSRLTIIESGMVSMRDRTVGRIRNRRLEVLALVGHKTCGVSHDRLLLLAYRKKLGNNLRGTLEEVRRQCLGRSSTRNVMTQLRLLKCGGVDAVDRVGSVGSVGIVVVD